MPVEPLTLERWAALDQAASPGPWYHFEGLSDEESGMAGGVEPGVVRALKDDAGEETSGKVLILDEFGKRADLAFIAASREAPTRLLAALRGLADRWWVSSNDINHNSDSKRERIRAYAFREASAQLRALIEQTDLSGDVK